MRIGLPLVAVLLAATRASAGDTTLQRDHFTSGSSINASVSFGEYEGAAVWLVPDGGYPLTIKAVDVLCVPAIGGTPGSIGAYLLDVWDDQALDQNHLPTQFTGNLVDSTIAGVQLTANATSFNRITLNPPVVLDGGTLFIAIREQTQSSIDGTTIALDTGPAEAGGNFYWHFSYDLMPDAGTGVAYPNANWIIRAVVQGPPTVAPTVTSITPSQSSGESVAVVITGTGFDLTSSAVVGDVAVSLSALNPPSELRGTLPIGLAPGVYDVKVTNTSSGLSGTLPQAFTVRLADGGQPPSPDSGSGGGAGGGAGGGGGSGGLSLTSVDPSEAFNGEDTTVTLLGSGFDQGVVVLVGSTVVDAVTRKNSAVLTAVVPKNFPVGTYDVSVVNPDASEATLIKALTVVTGVHVKSGCGCGAAEVTSPLLGLGLALLARARRRRALD